MYQVGGEYKMTSQIEMAKKKNKVEEKATIIAQQQ